MPHLSGEGDQYIFPLVAKESNIFLDNSHPMLSKLYLTDIYNIGNIKNRNRNINKNKNKSMNNAKEKLQFANKLT